MYCKHSWHNWWIPKWDIFQKSKHRNLQLESGIIGQELGGLQLETKHSVALLDNILDSANNNEIPICHYLVNEIWNIVCKLMKIVQGMMTKSGFLPLQWLHVWNLLAVPWHKYWLVLWLTVRWWHLLFVGNWGRLYCLLHLSQNRRAGANVWLVFHNRVIFLIVSAPADCYYLEWCTKAV